MLLPEPNPDDLPPPEKLEDLFKRLNESTRPIGLYIQDHMVVPQEGKVLVCCLFEVGDLAFRDPEQSSIDDSFRDIKIQEGYDLYDKVREMGQKKDEEDTGSSDDPPAK